MPADPPPARLEVKVGPLRGARFDLAGEATLGRHPDNAAVLEVPSISARHAHIFWDPEAGSYFLEDLGSRNGTALDGVPVAGRERLGRLHVITLGGLDLIYHGPELTAPRPAPAAAEPAAAGGVEEGTLAEEAPVALPGALSDRRERTRVEQEAPGIPAALANSEPRAEPDTGPERTRFEQELPPLPAALADSEPRTEPETESEAEPDTGPERTRFEQELPPLPAALAGPPAAAGAAPPEGAAAATAGGELAVPHLRLLNFGPMHDLPLTEGENRVGRAGEVEIPIPSPDVSRRHAVLTLRGGRVTLRDAGSRNRTWLDGAPLAEGAEVEVRPGAGLRFGSVEAELVAAGGETGGGTENDETGGGGGGGERR